jgi:hypothetical protein
LEESLDVVVSVIVEELFELVGRTIARIRDKFQADGTVHDVLRKDLGEQPSHQTH